MKTLESMNYREQDFDRCAICKYFVFDFDNIGNCLAVEDDNITVDEAGICDKYDIVRSKNENAQAD